MVNPDDGGDIFNWPWLVAGEMGDWKLTDAQADALRALLVERNYKFREVPYARFAAEKEKLVAGKWLA